MGRLEPVEVDARRDTPAFVIPSVPGYLLSARLQLIVNQRFHEPALYIEHMELHSRARRELEPDERRRIEGIRDVLVQHYCAR